MAGDMEDGSATSSGPADLSYVSGEYNAAFAAYAAQITHSPQDLDAWAGAILSLSELKEDHRTPLAVPELLPAVYAQAIESSPDVKDPVGLMRWLVNVTYFQ
jgi:hypothetical protein